MARDIIFDASVDKGNYDNNDAPYYESITKDGVTISTSNGLWNLTEDYYLVCKKTDNSSSGLSVSCNQLITKIVINCTTSGTSQYGPGNLSTSYSNGTYTFDGNVGVWTGYDSDIIVGAAFGVGFIAKDDVQINSIVVTVNESKLKGDVNGDGKVDPDDYNVLLRVLLGEYDDIVQGDLNGDGNINISDFNVLYNLIYYNYPFEVFQYINQGDVNDDGIIDNKDTKVIYDLIWHSTEYNENADINKDNVVDAWDYFIVELLIKNHNPYHFKLDNIKYDINEDQTSVTVTKDGSSIYNYSNLRGAVEIPSTVHYNFKDYVVTGIGSEAFRSSRYIASISIPNTVAWIGNNAFSNSNGLKSVTIGNSVTEIGNEAFYYCSRLTELYCYALEPPTLGSNCFWGVSNEIPVFVPIISAYVDDSGWSSYFTNFLPIGNNQKLTVNLPSAASGGKYKDMYIMAKNTTTDDHFRCLVTDNISYNFSVPGNATYNITLENSLSARFGEIKNVKVEDSDVSVTFSNLKQPQTVAMAVTLPDGEDVTSKVSVTWTDRDDNFLAQGASVSGMASGMELKYEVKLPQDLAMLYEQPTITEYIVKEGDNGFIVNLQPIDKSTLSGTVCDKATNRPINKANITISQTLNGKHSVSYTTTTDKDGNFSVEVYKVSSKVTIAAKDYVSKTTDITIEDQSVSLGTLQLEEIKGAVINVGFTYQASVKQGETPTVQNFFEDYNNVSYSIYNNTQKKYITQYSAQYPQIVLLEDVNDGDHLTVTATSIKGEFNDVQATCELNNKTASVTLPIVEHGAIEATYSDSQADNVVGMLYNSNGEQVARKVYNNKTLTIDNIADGNYTLVTMQANDYMNSVLTLGSLAATGLKASDDYISSTVSVNSGSICEIQITNVPVLDVDQLYYTSNSTYFNSNKSSVTVGNYVTLSANIDFKKAYQGQVQDISLVFDLPQGCEFVANSLMMGNDCLSYSINNQQIIVTDVVCGEKIKFCVIPTEPGMLQPSAMLHFTLNGKQVTQPIGSAVIEAKGLGISVPSVTSKPEIVISGNAPSGSSINIYDNGVLIGTTNANGSTWSAKCNLPNAYNLSMHKINAKAINPVGLELMSETSECTYDKNAIEVSKVIMLLYNGTNVVYNFTNSTVSPSSYSVFDDNNTFSFLIDFNDNDTTLISNVILDVKTSKGLWKALPATYDNQQSCWFASGNFYSSALPVNVAVRYDLLTWGPVSRQALNDAEFDYTGLSDDFNSIDLQYNVFTTQFESGNIPNDEFETAFDELTGMTTSNIDGTTYSNLSVEELISLSETLIQESDTLLNLPVNEAFARLCQFGKYDLSEFGIDGSFEVKSTDGITVEQLLDRGFEKISVDDDSELYQLVSETSYEIVDFYKGTYSILMFNPDNISLNSIKDENGIQPLLDKINEFNQKHTLLIGLVSDINDALSKIPEFFEFQIATIEQAIENNTIAYRALQAKLGTMPTIEENLAIQEQITKLKGENIRLGKAKAQLWSSFSATSKAIEKLTGILGAFMDAYTAGTNASAYVTLWNNVPSCPCIPSKTENLKNDILNAGLRCAGKDLANITGDLVSLYMIFDGSAMAAATEGTSLIMTVAGIGLEIIKGKVNAWVEKQFEKERARFRTRIRQLSNDISCVMCGDGGGGGSDGDNPGGGFPGGGSGSGCPDIDPIRLVDPSGFVYEAVPSNRLQGVTATIYYKETVEDMYGEPVEQEVMWDAEEYAQKNPLFTDENGMYQWDVPQGMWQVRFNKNGYEPTRSEWLPVPPPQLDVNIGMTQLRQPEVAMVHAYKDGVVLTFDKYMRPETLTTDNISVTQNGEKVTGTIELMNEEQGDNEKFASKLRFVPENEFTAKTVTLNVKSDVESYAGIRMNNDFTQTFDIEKQIYVIGIDTLINVGYGESRQVLVEALPVDVAKGKTLNVRSVQPLIAEVDNENYTLDKHGRATITIDGNLPGATSLILNVEGFDLKKNATVQVVDQSSLVTEKPIASVANGLVFDESFTVELTCSTPGAVIYYTTNGACPCDEEERILYNGPIPISKNTTLKAIAIAPGYYESDIATYYYFQSSAIDEISYDAPFKVTPTMVRDGFVVNGNFYECDMMLYSLNGSMVLHNEHVGSGEFVSLSSLNSGVYIAVVTINGRPYPVKIVKM